MSLKVIGAGLGRTGTTSLKIALTRLLGAPCYHMIDVFQRPADFAIWTAAGRGQPVDWHMLFDGYAAAVDWPAAAFWPEISAAFPEAFILHSTRDADSWWKSASETIFTLQAPPPALVEMLDAVFGTRFTRDTTNKEAAVAALERHTARVRAEAPKARLVEWTSHDGWGPLCSMLGVPVPNEPFPHANTTEEFRARRTGGGPRSAPESS